MRDFELNLSMEELEKRTHKDYLITKKFNHLPYLFITIASCMWYPTMCLSNLIAYHFKFDL